MFTSAVRTSTLLSSASHSRCEISANITQHFAVWLSSDNLTGSSAFSICPHPAPRGGQGFAWEVGAGCEELPSSTCGDPVEVTGLFVGVQILFSPFTPLHFFPGQYSVLKQSFALIFITLGSSLLYKPANFQSHLLTYTEIQAGHKNVLGNVSKQWQGFLMAEK